MGKIDWYYWFLVLLLSVSVGLSYRQLGFETTMILMVGVLLLKVFSKG